MQSDFDPNSKKNVYLSLNINEEKSEKLQKRRLIYDDLRDPSKSEQPVKKRKIELVEDNYRLLSSNELSKNDDLADKALDEKFIASIPPPLRPLPLTKDQWNNDLFILINMGANNIPVSSLFNSMSVIPFIKEVILDAQIEDPLLVYEKELFARLDNLINLKPDEKGDLSQKDKTEIIELLKKRKKIEINTGYSAKPWGHSVLLELSLNSEGYVTGKVIQAGEGIKYHGFEICDRKSFRDQGFRGLFLERVSLEEFQKSDFLDQLTNLNAENEELNLLLSWNIHQFYGIAIAGWPGGISANNETRTNGLQRGPTCDLKVFLVILRSYYKDEPHIYQRVKLYLRLYSTQAFLENLIDQKIPSIRISYIKIALEKSRNTLAKLNVGEEDCLCQRFFSLEAKATEEIKKMKERHAKNTVVQEKIRGGICIFGDTSLCESVTIKKKDLEFKSSYELKDIKAVAEEIKNLEDQSQALALSLHVLKNLPLASQWSCSWKAEYAELCQSLDVLILAIVKNANINKGPVIITPVQKAVVCNAAGGLINASISGGYPISYTHWLARLFYSSKMDAPIQHLDTNLRRLDFSGLEILKKFKVDASDDFTLDENNIFFDSNKCSQNSNQNVFIEALLKLEPKKHLQNLFDWDIHKNQIYQCPLGFAMVFFFASRDIKARCNGIQAIHSFHRNNNTIINEFIRIKGATASVSKIAGMQSYYPWTPDELEFISDILNFSESENHLFLSTQTEFFLGKTLLNSLELHALRSIAISSDLLLYKLFDYFTSYPQRLEDDKFLALFEMFMCNQFREGVNQFNHFESSRKAIEFLEKYTQKFFKNHLSHFLKKWNHMSYMGLLRIFALMQNYLSVNSQELFIFFIEQIKKNQLFSEQQKHEINMELIALTPYLSNLSILESTYYELINSDFPIDNKSFKRIIVKDDFDLGFYQLKGNYNDPTRIVKKRLPSEIALHKYYPFQERNPKIDSEEDLNGTTIYTFTDRGAQCSVILDDNYGSVRFTQKMDDTLFTVNPGYTLFYLTISENRIEEIEDSEDFELRGQCNKSKNLYLLKEPPIYSNYFDPYYVSPWISKNYSYLSKKNEPTTILGLLKPNKDLPRENYEIYHPVNDWRLGFINTKSSLTSLAPPKEILPWIDQNNDFISIEYPNLGIHFDWDGLNNHYYLRSDPFYYVIIQNLPEIESLSPYVVLTNDKHKIVFIPKIPPFTDEKNQWSELKASVCFSFPLSKEGEILFSDDNYANVYLICLLMRSNNYEKARRYTSEFIRHPRGWSSAELKLLKEPHYFYPLDLFKEDEDTSASCAAIRLRLLLSAIPENRSFSIDEGNKVVKDYHNYLDQLNSVGEEWLTTDEEVRCLKIVKKIKWNPSFNNRYNYFNLKMSSRPSMSNLDIFHSYSFFNRVNCHLPLVDFSINEKIEKIALNLTSGQRFIRHYSYYYQKALNITNSERDQYREELKTLLFDSNPEIRLGCGKLLYILEKGQNTDNIDEIWQYIEKIYNQIQKKFFKPYNMRTISNSRLLLSPEVQDFLEVDDSPVKFVSYIPELLNLFLEKGVIKHELFPESNSVLEKLHSIYSFKHSEPCVERVLENRRSGIEILQQNLKRQSVHTALSLPSKIEERLERLLFITQALNNAVNTIEEKISNKRERIENLLVLSVRVAPHFKLPSRLTIEDIFIHLARGEDKAILKHNPALTVDDLITLKRIIKELLILETEQQLLTRSLSALATLRELCQDNSCEQAIMESCDSFIDLFTATRQYELEANETLPFLVFERFTNKRLLETQFKILNGIVRQSDQLLNIQAGTGIGKSSTISPLWLFLMGKKKGHKRRIPVMTGPSSLIEEQVVILKNTVGKSLASRIFHIEFDREKARNYQELKKIRKMMEKAPEEGFIFLMSINSAQILSNLALKEHLIKNGLKGSHSSEIAMIEQELFRIRKLWKEEVCNFVDESRTVLGSDKHVFALGSKIPLSESHLNRATRFYCEIVFDQDIILKWRFNFLKNRGVPEEQHTRLEITPESFPILKEELIQAIIKKKGLHQSERDYFQGLTNDFDSDPDLRYYKNQLNVYLPHCLTAKQGSRYDVFPDNGSLLAVPCMAGVPRPSYEFSTKDELINFTFQANLAHEISKGLVCEFINTLDAFVIKGESCSHHQILFNTILKNLKIKKIESHADVNLICNYLNEPKNIVDKTCFLGITVVSKISTFSHKVESSSHSFIFSHTTLHGASATVNGDLMPPEITTVKDPTAGIENLCALVKQNSQVFTTSETESFSILRACLKHEFQVLIDLAGLFSELSEETIVTSIFDLHHECRAVHYYNVKGEPMLWKRDQKVPQLRKKTDKLEQNFFTYIRESKSEGTDTPMQTGAKALVTVDWRTTQTSADQAIGRMRGLKKGESIHFFTTEKNILLINERLKQEGIPFKDSLEALLRYFSIKDGIQNSHEYYAALISYYFALVENLAWELVSNDSNRGTIFSQSESILSWLAEPEYTTIPEQIWDLVSKEESNKGKIFSQFEPILSLLAEPENPIIPTQIMMSAELAVHHIKKKFRNSLQAIGEEHQLTINLDQIEKRFDLFAKDWDKKLTKEIKSGDLTGTSEQLTMVDVVLEAEHSTQVQQHKALASFCSPIDPLSSILENDKGIVLGIPVLCTNNYSIVSEDPSDNLKHRKPGYFSTIKINGNTIQLCALSIFDAIALNRQLSQQSTQMVNREREGQEGIFLLVKDEVIATNDPALEIPTLDEIIKNIPIPDLNKKIKLLCKLFGRQEKFSIEEFSFLSSEQIVEAKTWAACNLNLNINVF